MTPKYLHVWSWFARAPFFVCLAACGKNPAENETEAKQADYRDKYANAKKVFEERCKSAGIVVKRTVQDVEGIELIKVRPKLEWGDKRYFDQMFDGAAMVDDGQGVGYIESFLWAEYRNRFQPTDRGQLNPASGPSAENELPPQRGYKFVEAKYPSDGQLRRYRLPPNISRQRSDDPGVVQEKAGEKQQRYTVDYEDIVNQADRALWIAGTKIKVIDRQTNEVIAELTRFVWDPGFGDTSTGRWPWQHAGGRSDRNCPQPYKYGYQTRKLVDTILIPKQGG